VGAGEPQSACPAGQGAVRPGQRGRHDQQRPGRAEPGPVHRPGQAAPGGPWAQHREQPCSRRNTW
jgi:hypothetical protein